jgi:hypothetical protein
MFCLEEFRNTRRNQIANSFSGRKYLMILSFFSGFFSSFLFGFGTFSLFPIILALFYANFAEYILHRCILHRYWGWNKETYKQHSGNHHRFFTFANMSITDPKDICEIITTPKKLGIVFAIAFLPAFIFGITISLSFGVYFLAVLIFYQLIYEWFHLACHLPEKLWFFRVPLLRNSLYHHRKHHDLRSMRNKNFNMFIPLFDCLFKTKI